MMDAQKISEIIQDNRSKYNYFGLRAMTDNPETGKPVTARIGNSLGNSYHWIDNESTGEMIDGVCALGIDVDDSIDVIEKVIKSLKIYHTHQVVLIGALSHDYGDDEGEIILRQSEVLMTWRK